MAARGETGAVASPLRGRNGPGRDHRVGEGRTSAENQECPAHGPATTSIE
jgi:hypothetical protein